METHDPRRPTPTRRPARTHAHLAIMALTFALAATCWPEHLRAQQPSGLPATITLSAAQSPTGSSVTLTWENDITNGNNNNTGLSPLVGGWSSSTAIDYTGDTNSNNTGQFVALIYDPGQQLNYDNGDEYILVAYDGPITDSAAQNGQTNTGYTLADSAFSPDNTNGSNSYYGNYAGFQPTPINVPEPPASWMTGLAAASGGIAILLRNLYSRSRA